MKEISRRAQLTTGVMRSGACAGAILLAVTIAMSLSAGDATAQETASQSPPARATIAHGPDALAGVWVLDQSERRRPGQGTAPEGDESGRRGGDRDGRGGRSGGRRSGGIGGLGGGRRGGGGGRDAERDPAQLQAMANYVRALNEASDRMTILVHEKSVVITESDGARVTLQTDDKKVTERAENGLVKLNRKAHWDGSTLVVEVDVDGGPEIERRYELSPAATELRIATTIKGDRGGRGGRETRPFVHVYQRPDE